MNTRVVIPAKALALFAGLAVLLAPTALASGAAKKAPAKKACVLKKKAKCKKAHISKAKVGKVNLTGANLAGATITGATFNGTNLTGVNLTGAKISNTTFTSVNATNLNLAGAHLTKVTFTKARTSGGQSALALENACEPATPGPDWLNWPGGDWFRCTGGGISAPNADIRNTKFINSDIPGSNFSNVYSFNVQFLVSHVDRSNFADSIGFMFAGTAGALDSSSSESIFDRARLAAFDTKFLRSSFADVVDWAINASYRGLGSLDGGTNDLTGARGLEGTAPVTINAAPGVAVGAILIRENGYWRPGILCESAPCIAPKVAIGSPVVVTVGGPAPIALTIAGWSCGEVAPITSGSSTSYQSRCTTDALPPASTITVGTARSVVVAPVTKRVTVSAQDGFTRGPAPITSMRIDQLAALGGVVDTTTCFSQTSCTRDVPVGTSVRVTMTDATHPLVGWCTPTDVMFSSSAPPNSTYTCADTVVNSDLDVVVRLS